jgi:hypothetical protein
LQPSPPNPAGTGRAAGKNTDRPADLPAEQPDQDPVINLKTAALGLKVQPTLFGRDWFNEFNTNRPHPARQSVGPDGSFQFRLRAGAAVSAWLRPVSN